MTDKTVLEATAIISDDGKMRHTERHRDTRIDWLKADITIHSIRRALVLEADPKKAVQMQRYMKSEMPFHGVQSPVLKKICATLFSQLEFSNQQDWITNVQLLWDKAKFREERYCALHLAAHKSARLFQNTKAMPLYERLIVTGAWWDFVDDLAIHKVGPILLDYSAPMKKKMLVWSRSENIWKRRTAILSQLSFKERTDYEHLYACIKPSMASNEFFLQKAIGWALRQIAWRDPKEIIAFVKRNKDSLQPLSKREALKNLVKSGQLKQVP